MQVILFRPVCSTLIFHQKTKKNGKNSQVLVVRRSKSKEIVTIYHNKQFVVALEITIATISLLQQLKNKRRSRLYDRHNNKQ